MATNSKYKGNWKKGLKHGNGKQTWNDGSYYDGDWVNDGIDGTGTY